MHNELSEIFKNLSSDHQAQLLHIAKDMEKIEATNKLLAELTAIK